MAISVLEELRNFEKEQEDKLKQAESDSISAVGKARADIDKKLKDEKERLNTEKNEKIAMAKEKAKEEAKEIVGEYKQRIVELEKRSSKNFDKAVDGLFLTVLQKNG